MDLQYQLNSGKTVTWFTQDQHQRITAINYPISHALEGSEEVVTYADTKLYPGEARELQIRCCIRIGVIVRIGVITPILITPEIMHNSINIGVM